MINSNYILILSFFVLSIPYIEYGYVISFPQELFGNLLLLYCSHGLHDRAADIQDDTYYNIQYIPLTVDQHIITA